MNELSGPGKPGLLKMLLLTGLLVGSLDILAACTDYYIATGKGPAGVLRYVASGIFGKEAFTGSGFMNVWGLLFHFIIAYSFTFLFYWLYRKWNFIRDYPVITAIGYGILMWFITTQVVIPLSNVPESTVPRPLWKIAKAILILIGMICVPLTLIFRKYGRLNK